jgi:conjugal transfer mating pair stabilization protein TraG
MDFPIVVYGNADLYAECFNAIAATLGSNAYSTLLRISVLLAGITMLVSFTAKRDLMLIVRWFGVFYLVIFMLFMPKVTVHVLDRVNNGSDHPVDNVPLGLAVMASYTSLLGDALTQFLDETFSLPDDLRYTRTGMVMASRLVLSASEFQITDSEFNSDIQEFMHQCVFYDLLLRKYTVNDLMRAENAWEFIKTNTSKARAFAYDGNVTPCQIGAGMLGARWTKMISDVAKQYGTRLFPKSKEPEKDLKSRLVASYQYLLNNLSVTPGTIFSQHLMKNIIERGVIRMDGTLDANAALQTYAYTRGMDQLRATFFSVGDLVGAWIQYFKNAIEIITYALFIFVVLLSVFPFGTKVLKNYFITLMWLQCWAPIYAIINLIISFYAKSNSLGASHDSLSLDTILAVSQANIDMTGLAGYLTLLVPAISWGIVKGMESTFSHINHSFGGLMQSSVSNGIAEATTGNFSFGNTNIGNHSTANNSGFHWDTSGRFSSGMLQTQLASGAMMMNTSDGHAMVDMRPTISSLGTNVEYGGSVRKGLTKMADKSTTAAFNQTTASSEAHTESMKNLYEIGNHLGMTEGSSASWTMSTNAGTAEAYRNAMQLTERFAEDHKISFGDAAKVLSSAHANVSAGIGTRGVGIGASVGGRRGADHIASYDNSHLYDAAKSYIRDSGYSHNVDIVERAARDKQLRINNEEGNRLAKNMGASFDKAESYRAESINSLQQAESYRQTANEVSENSMNYRTTMDQQLAEYIANQPHPDGSGAITMSRLSDITSNHALMGRYVDRFVQENINSFMPSKMQSGLPNSSQQVVQTFKNNSQHIHSEKSIQDHYNSDKQYISNQAMKKGISPRAIDYSTKQQVDNEIAKQRQQVHVHHDEIDKQGEGYETKYKNESGNKRHGNLVEDAWNGIDTKDKRD